MYNKIFLKKLLWKVVVDIFKLLLAHFAPKLVNYSRHNDSLKYVWKLTNVVDFRNLPNALRLTVPRMINQFGRKRCQKKRKVVGYKLLQEFFQKYFVVHQRSGVKNSFSTYVYYAPDGLFWLNL